MKNSIQLIKSNKEELMAQLEPEQPQPQPQPAQQQRLEGIPPIRLRHYRTRGVGNNEWYFLSETGAFEPFNKRNPDCHATMLWRTVCMTDAQKNIEESFREIDNKERMLNSAMKNSIQLIKSNKEELMAQLEPETNSVLAKSGLSVFPYVINKFLNALLAGAIVSLLLRLV